MKRHLLRVREELGLTGLASLVLLAAAFLFFTFALEPLQEKSVLLQAELAQDARKAPSQSASAGERIGAFYRFLDKPEATTDWLAKLYGVGEATGVRLQSASYKAQPGGRLARTEILLPVSGSYPQIREFLKRALAEVPVLSLDQMTLRRDSRNDGVLQAELRFTLHEVKSEVKR